MNNKGHIILPYGRRLACAEFGKMNGYPLMYFHGAFSSRPEPLLVGDDVFSRFDAVNKRRSDYHIALILLCGEFGLRKQAVEGHPVQQLSIYDHRTNPLGVAYVSQGIAIQQYKVC